MRTAHLRRYGSGRRLVARPFSSVRDCAARSSLVSGACFLVFLSGWRKDVEHHGPRVGQGASAVWYVGRRLPEVAGPDVMLCAGLDADPLALEADAPLLVRV